MLSGRQPRAVRIDGKIAAQLAARGWTVEQVQEVANAPPIGISTDSTGGSADPATVFGSRSGGYVVVNDRTGRVIQISDKGDSGWIPDSRIRWI